LLKVARKHKKSCFNQINKDVIKMSAKGFLKCMDSNKLHCCPVCKAKFRGTRKCSRCGADLSAIMRLCTIAKQNRENCRTAILSNDFEKAYDLAQKAQGMHNTNPGKKLLILSSWLNSIL